MEPKYVPDQKFGAMNMSKGFCVALAVAVAERLVSPKVGGKHPQLSLGFTARLVSIGQSSGKYQLTAKTDIFYPLTKRRIIADAAAHQPGMSGFMYNGGSNLLDRGRFVENEPLVEDT